MLHDVLVLVYIEKCNTRRTWYPYEYCLNVCQRTEQPFWHSIMAPQIDLRASVFFSKDYDVSSSKSTSQQSRKTYQVYSSTYEVLGIRPTDSSDSLVHELHELGLRHVEHRQLGLVASHKLQESVGHAGLHILLSGHVPEYHLPRGAGVLLAGDRAQELGLEGHVERLGGLLLEHVFELLGHAGGDTGVQSGRGAKS